jgi:hypothetical protein
LGYTYFKSHKFHFQVVLQTLYTGNPDIQDFEGVDSSSSVEHQGPADETGGDLVAALV